MRKILRFIPLAVFMMLSSAAIAQSESSPEKKNIIKLNLSSLVFKNFSFQYERVLSRKTSVALGMSFLPKSDLPFKKTLKDKFGDNSDAARAIEDTKLGNFSITPEFRFYLGKKAPKGFYIAPFARYNSLKFDQLYRFTTGDNVDHVANIKGNINNFGGGLLFGAQWHLSQRFTLDWWILGPVVGSGKGTLVGTDPINIKPEDRADIENDIEDVDLPGTKVEATVEQNKITAKLSGPYYGLRAFGIVLGFKF